MDHIPTELLHKILIKLDLKNRLKCMLVCRSWYNILDQRCLLYDLDITSREYHKLKVMMERFPYRGAQTESLAMHLTIRSDFDKRKLLNVFPNLRVLKLKAYNFQKFENHMKRPLHFTISTSKLERIADIGECELTRQLVLSNLCNNLKTLELNLKYSTDAVRSSVVPQLKSMPVLEHLGLIRPAVTLMDLDKLHHNLPTLTSLHLEAHILSGEKSRDIIPATLITKLKMAIHAVDDLNTHVQFYKYICDKYPSVKKPTCDDAVVLNKDMDYVWQIYNEGIFPFNQRMALEISDFSFRNYNDRLDAFRRFDEFEIKLKSLTIGSINQEEHDTFSLGQLAQSQQAKSITILTLNDIIPEPIHWMKNMETLKLLEITTGYSCDDPLLHLIKKIDFSQLVEAVPPTLTDLVLSGLYLTFNGTVSSQTSIECLDLSYIYLDQRLANVIETSFPKLVQLLFDVAIPSDVTLSLPKHKLEVVEIKVNYERMGYNGFIITTTDDDLVEHYGKRKFKDYDDNGRLCEYDEVICVSKEEFNDGSVLSLTCASIDELSLHVEDCY